MIYRLPHTILKLIPKEVTGDCGIYISHEGYALSFGTFFVMKIEDEMLKQVPDITVPFSAFSGLVGFIYYVHDEASHKHAMVCSRVQIIDNKNLTKIIRKCNWFTPLKPREIVLSESTAMLKIEGENFTIPATVVESITALSKDAYDYITLNIKDNHVTFTLFSDVMHNKSKFSGSIAFVKRTDKELMAIKTK